MRQGGRTYDVQNDINALCRPVSNRSAYIFGLVIKAISASASAVTRVASNLYFTVIAPLPTVRCDCALRSLEIAEPFLLVGAENFVNLGLHAGVRDDQPCQQICFCIGESFDLLLIHVFTADCKQLLSCSSKLRHQRLETMLFPHHDSLESLNLGWRQT
jgi:hypothetical protein